MGITLDEFKQFVQNREFNNFRLYSKIINQLNTYYNEVDFKFFYPRNVFNDKETELIFFLNDGYFVVTIDNQSVISIKQFYCKVVNKTLILPGYENDKHELIILFDNGKELIMNSVEDSTEDWKPDYNHAIKDLFKII